MKNTKKRFVNNGEVPMCYVEKGHPTIEYIERYGVGQLDFARVEDNPFTERIICGNFGRALS
ncbi:hypothetical protein [Proteiniborus sp. DW1]|uniref:hypothetical protein n=1 Tax=Proteiniborus sp. DW1 TaxID=1889883 RepID=UPI00117B5BD9|nr:hypothetical protein [Proteiniborus sp. DW1]